MSAYRHSGVNPIYYHGIWYFMVKVNDAQNNHSCSVIDELEGFIAPDFLRVLPMYSELNFYTFILGPLAYF